MSQKRNIADLSSNDASNDASKKVKFENALKRLNQMHPGTFFTIDKVTGPPHQPIFTMYFMVGGKKISGSGTTKQEAKRKAAENYFELQKKGVVIREEPTDTPKDKILDLNEPQTYSEWKAKCYSKDNYLTLLLKEYPGLEFTQDEVSGPTHQRIFNTSFTINDIKYCGSGNSKQKAKYNAAFKYFMQLKNSNNSEQISPERNLKNEADSNASKAHFYSPEKEVALDKNFTSRLVREHPGIIFNVDEKYGPPHKPTFVVSFELNGEKYRGVGHSLKEAKQNAASSYFQIEKKPESIKLRIKRRIEKEPLIKPLMILREIDSSILECFHTEKCPRNQPLMSFRSSLIFNGKLFIGFGPTEEQSQNDAAAKLLNLHHGTTFPASLINDNLKSKPHLLGEFTRNMVTTIAKAYSGIIATLTKKIIPEAFSCIVMTKDKEMSNLQVVSLAVGNKWLNAQPIDKNGETLYDCHSEILVRRAFINFIYFQLEDFIKEPHMSIFEKGPTGKPVLKPFVKFHFYTTGYPCGALQQYGNAQNTLNMKNLCLLRAKILQGDQTIPLVEETSGDQDHLKMTEGKLHSMSCTDKISQWQYLGFQGALLTHFIDPLYVDSFSLCKDFNSSIFKYVICKRVESRVVPNPPFTLNVPRFAKAPKVPLKGPPANYAGTGLGMTWCKGQSAPEIINGLTGKLESGDGSSLSKKALFKRHKMLAKSLDSSSSYATYHTAKSLATDYKRLKNKIIAAFSESNLGTWLKKNDFENFDVDI